MEEQQISIRVGAKLAEAYNQASPETRKWIQSVIKRLLEIGQVELPSSWSEVSQKAEAPALEKELRKEVGLGHVLHATEVHALARRTDNDDVLFCVDNDSSPLAVVHLTWQGKQTNPNFPWTTFYNSIDDWLTRSQEDFQ